MNYLKSITSTVLNSTGVSFPFSIGERLAGVTSETSLWEVREGVKKVHDPYLKGSRQRTTCRANRIGRRHTTDIVHL